jgi:hypothetical protein
VVWLAYTLLAGAVSGWYPYPFLDVGQRQPAQVALACLMVTVAILVVSALLWWGDRRLPQRPARTGASPIRQVTP